MNTQEQAYINGFVKRAAEYGYSPEQAVEILKLASPETLAMSPGAKTWMQAGQPEALVAPAAKPQPLRKNVAPPAVTPVAAPAAKRRVPKKTVGTPEPVQGPRSASGARSYFDMNKAYGIPE
jgi:hypothetical protein